MTKWSYKREAIFIDRGDCENRLNELGRLGWELKFVRFSEDSMFPSVCIFMRPQLTEAEEAVLRLNSPESKDL